MYKSHKLAKSLTHLIESGVWQTHDRLPSLRQQAKTSGFSLMTVLHAYQLLESQGLIYSQEKLGYFVAEQKRNNVADKSVHPLKQKVEINSRVFHFLKSLQHDQIIPLGSAFPDSQQLYCEKLMQILSKQAKSKSSYEQMPSLPPGNLELRKLIAQRYAMQGIPTDPSDIVITSGGLDALNLSLQAMTQAGDCIVLQETSFYGAWQAAERLRLKVITIPEHPTEGLDLDALEHVLQNYPIKVCLFMLNSQNPIGYTVSDEIKAKLAKLLETYQVYLIEDDVYEELYYGNKKPLSMKYFDQHHHILHCSSFSKTLGAGFRLGWVHAGKFSEVIQHTQLMSTLSVNSFIQNALVDYLSHRHYDRHLKALRQQLEYLKTSYYQYLEQRLSSEFRLHYYPSGYFLWMTLPSQLCGDIIYQRLRQDGIIIASGSLFYLKEGPQHHLRINCSFEFNANIQRALDQLIEVLLDEYQKLEAP